MEPNLVRSYLKRIPPITKSRALTPLPSSTFHKSYKSVFKMPLQDLPSELLIFILASVGSRSDLLAIASTSQRIYSVFVSEKAALIYQALADELGPVLNDAIALSKIETLDALSPSYHREVQALVSMYDGYLTGQTRSSSRRVSLDDVLSLVDLSRTMSYLARVYITSRLKLFQNELQPLSTLLVGPPSRTEYLRILHAFFRLQIIFNLYGHPALGVRRKHNRPDTECINYRLFGLWEAWEFQQILCVATFVTRLHRQFIRLQDRNLRVGGISKRSLYGLDVLRSFITKVRNVGEATWQDVLQETSNLKSGLHLMGSPEQYGLQWLHDRYYRYRMTNFPPGRDNCPIFLPFRGEHSTTAPFAWVDAFDGEYPHDFDGRLAGAERGILSLKQPNKPIDLVWCCFGFAMWDAPRVAALNKALGLGQYRTGWAVSE